MKYLTVSLYHPRVMKGGAQYVAKDLHDMARADDAVAPVLLAGIDGNMFPQYAKVGSAITALPDSPDEFLLPGQSFDDFHHVIYDPRRNKAIKRFLEDHKPDVIHVHHSLWIGLEFLQLARQVLPDVKIIYTLHEYLPICYLRGQLFRDSEGSICHDAAPDQCTRCFPDRTADDFILRRRGFKRAFELVDHFISPSEYLRQRFITWGLAADRISVIANGHMQQRPAGWTPTHSPGLNVFGFFGQYVDVKGIDVLLRAAAHCRDACLHLDDLPTPIRTYALGSPANDAPDPCRPSTSSPPPSRGATLADLERAAIERELARCNGNVTAVGKVLGIGRTTLYRRLKEYGLR